jgi:VanZ family protein
MFSSDHTSRILFPVFHYLFGFTPEQFAPVHAVLRKTGHVLGYGFLSLLLYRAWRRTVYVAGHPRWSMVWSRIAVLMTAFVASLDEWHQTFLPSRTGAFHDVVLDTCAGIAAQYCLYLFFTRRRA